FSWGNLYKQIGAFIESTSYTQRVLKESVPPIFQSTEAFQTTMVGSMKTRGKTAAMDKSAMAQSHSTYDPAVGMVAPPPLITAPPTGPAAGSSNLRGTATEHGGTSHQGGLVTTTDLGPVLEQLQAFPLLPPRSMHAPTYTSNETLALVQLGSTHFSPPDPRSQADLNLRVDQLAQRMDDQTSLMRQLLNQMNLVQNLGLGQPGEERRMDERTDRQLNEYPAGRAGVGRQSEGQQLDRPTDMSQASASPTQSRLRLRNNVRERLGPQGGQQDNHRNEDHGERRSAVHSQRSIHERLGPHGGQPDNPHNEDHEERRFVAHSRRDGSRRRATENISQAQSTNTPPRQRRREGRPSQTNEEIDGNFEDALRREVDQANSTPFTAEIEQAAPPKRFSTPSFTHFKGDSDPETHLKHFKSIMIFYKANDALMCKVSFKELAHIFTKEYTSYRTIKKNPDHLFNLQKKDDESLRDYIKRFKAERANIIGCDDRITSSAFKRGLPIECELYRELTISPCQTLVEVFAIAERYALWDDDR
ncbi:unnamed protein product, partial [Prunus brigantina]